MSGGRTACRRTGTGFEGANGLVEDGMEGRGRHRIEHGADVIGTGDFGHLEQCLAVRSALAFEQLALMGREGWTLHEENRERRHADIRNSIMAVAAVR